jgi:hypothetical protein
VWPFALHCPLAHTRARLGPCKENASHGTPEITACGSSSPCCATPGNRSSPPGSISTRTSLRVRATRRLP